MQKKLFNKIIIESNKILNHDSSNATTASISSLNINKFHPEYLKKATDVSIYVIFQTCFLQLLHILQSLFYKKNILNKIKRKKVDILIISHLTNVNQLDNKSDPYFGSVEKLFEKNKFKTHKLLINHTTFNENRLNQNLIKKNITILNKVLDIKTELTIFINKISEFVRLLRNKIKEKDNFKKQILNRTMLSLFGPETSFAMRLKIQIENSLSILNPSIMISTYEGYGWESICFRAAKNYDYQIKCIGFQHTPIDQTISPFKKNNNFCNPDIIWCSDLQSLKLIKKYNKTFKKKIFHIGNLKENNKNKLSPKKNSLNTCLVLPEGIYNECITLLKFSLKCLQLDNSINFIWRLHPIINVKKVLSLLDLKHKQLPKNIKISTEKNILFDSNKAKFVLYRGSAAVIQPSINGNIPIYLKDKNNINIDPLQKTLNNFNYVSSEKDFISKIKFYSKNNKNYKRKFVDKLLRNFNPKIKKNLIIKSLKN